MINLASDLVGAVNAPEFITEWLDRFYEPKESAMLAFLGNNDCDADALAKKTGLSVGDIERSWRRGVLDRNENGRYSSADFHTRYDIWSVFEGFKDLPGSVRDLLNRWELDMYIDRCSPALEFIRRNGHGDPKEVTPRYMLLDETFNVLDRVDRIYLWPCNCRSMIGGCSKPVFTCLRFDNNRGIGFEISREKAKAIAIEANRKGLMQSGELGRDDDGRLKGAICNCCPDCCFPHLLALHEGEEKRWPLSRYVARLHSAPCRMCRKCVSRCPFDAIEIIPETHDTPPLLRIHSDQCRGCGLCATGCPEKAIAMILLDGAAPLLPPE